MNKPEGQGAPLPTNAPSTKPQPASPPLKPSGSMVYTVQKGANTIPAFPDLRKKRGKASVGKTFVENISIFGLTARMAPLGLQMYAADFLAAAKAIQPPNGPFAPDRP